MQVVIIIGLTTREHKLSYNSQVRWHFLRFTRMQHEPEVGFNICIWHYILCLVWLAAGHCTGIGQSKKQTLITITISTTPPMVKCSYKRRSFFCEPTKVSISSWNWQSSNSKDSLNREETQSQQHCQRFQYFHWKLKSCCNFKGAREFLKINIVFQSIKTGKVVELRQFVFPISYFSGVTRMKKIWTNWIWTLFLFWLCSYLLCTQIEVWGSQPMFCRNCNRHVLAQP